MDQTPAILNQFNAISLKEMNEVRLLNRSDTKYVFHLNKLEDVLKAAFGTYKILTINDLNIIPYKTLYFDLPNLKFYYDHHNGLRSRFKVRFREYLDSGTIFLEVKEKNNKDKTIKRRIRVEHMEDTLSDSSAAFIEKFTNLDAGQLFPALETNFSRITLVNESDRQRITIDLNVSFKNKTGSKELPYLVICEIKQDRNVGQNVFGGILKSHRIYPLNMSKYGIGTALLNPGIKQNRFKEKILTLNTLRHDTGSYQVAG